VNYLPFNLFKGFSDYKRFRTSIEKSVENTEKCKENETLVINIFGMFSFHTLK
jgi:hypothetical protein